MIKCFIVSVIHTDGIVYQDVFPTIQLANEHSTDEYLKAVLLEIHGQKMQDAFDEMSVMVATREFTPESD